MASTFHLTVLTPQRSVLDQDVEHVQAPGMLGYFGILANHAPLISALVPGTFRVKATGGTETTYALNGGFLEVSGNQVIVLADSLERSDEIDTARAREAETRANDRVAQAARDRAVDAARARAALARAKNRLRIGAGR